MSNTAHRLNNVFMHRVGAARVGLDKPSVGCPGKSVFFQATSVGNAAWYGRIQAEGDIKDGTGFHDDPCFNNIDLNTDGVSGHNPEWLAAYQDAYLAAFLKDAPGQVPAAKMPTPFDPAPAPEEMPVEVPPTSSEVAAWTKLLAEMPVPPPAYDGSLPPGTPGGPPAPGVLVFKEIASSPEALVRAIAKAARTPTPGAPGSTPGSTPASTTASTTSDTTKYVIGGAALLALLFFL